VTWTYPRTPYASGCARLEAKEYLSYLSPMNAEAQL